MYEKSATNFYTLQCFSAQGQLMCQKSTNLVVMYSKAPSIKLPNFIDFVDGVTDRQTKTVNDVVSALPLQKRKVMSYDNLGMNQP